MKKKRSLRRRVDSRIRWFCRRLTNRQRKIAVATAFTLFLISCLYIIATSLSGFGTPKRHYEIEHIRPSEPLLNKGTINKNNHPKKYDDDRHSENQEAPGADFLS